MRFLIVAFAILAMPAVASAQTAAWTDPEGQFTVSFAAHNWSIAENEPLPDGDDMRILLTVRAPEGSASCEVNVLVNPNATRQTRQRLNEFTASLRERAVATMQQNPQYTLIRAGVAEIDTVAVLDMHGRFASLRTVERRFFLQPTNALHLYTLVCSVDGADRAGVASMEAVADSLRFPGVAP